MTVGYDGIPILGGVNINAGPGETVGIVGGNGSGKSTLLQTMSGVIPPLGGDILIGGRSAARRSAAERVRELGLAYLPQHGRRIPNLTVSENLHLAQWGRGSRADRARSIEQVLGEQPFTQLKGHLHEHAGALSGGQSLLLALAILSIQELPVILLDEPSDGLDEYNRGMLVELIRKMKSGGRALLLVEQLLRVVFSTCDRVYVAGQLRSRSAVQHNPSRHSVGRLRELEAGKVREIRDIYARHSPLLPAHTQSIDALLWGS